MKFAFYKTSDHYNNIKVIDVETLSELLSMIDDMGEVVMGLYYMTGDKDEPHYFIEHYDDYRE